ncbi:VOC family protein [Streptomyces cynarae]|uniref:VOC family protein n=1 Tax=Streptomyces cynarae TaxID=2981134 RepID=UPI00406C5DE5
MTGTGSGPRPPGACARGLFSAPGGFSARGRAHPGESRPRRPVSAAWHGVLATDDIHGDYKRLKDRGVEFLQEPQERPYGTEALFRDDSGNWFSFTQRREGGLDFEKEWS